MCQLSILNLCLPVDQWFMMRLQVTDELLVM